MDLLQNNADCELPCWWGIIPGQTSWQEAQSFLATFAYSIGQGGSSERPLYTAHYIVPESVFPAALNHDYQVENGIITQMEVRPGFLPAYSLSTFLSNNGEPTEIWISTYNELREGILPFFMILYFPDRGMLARYVFLAELVGDQVRACPTDKPDLILAFFVPEPDLTLQEAAEKTRRLRLETEPYYLTLQEASGMNIEAFHQRFSEPKNGLCLDSPIELWPAH